jgi:hypothetical protein
MALTFTSHVGNAIVRFQYIDRFFSALLGSAMIEKIQTIWSRLEAMESQQQIGHDLLHTTYETTDLLLLRSPVR